MQEKLSTFCSELSSCRAQHRAGSSPHPPHCSWDLRGPRCLTAAGHGLTTCMAKLFYLSSVTPWLMQEGKLDPILQHPRLQHPPVPSCVNPIAPDPGCPQGAPGAAEPTWSSCEQLTTLCLAAQTEAILAFAPTDSSIPSPSLPAAQPQPALKGQSLSKQHSYRGERKRKACVYFRRRKS